MATRTTSTAEESLAWERARWHRGRARAGNRRLWSPSLLTGDSDSLPSTKCATQMCPSTGRTEGRSNKGSLSVQVSLRDTAVLTLGCVGCLHCSVTKHAGLFEGGVGGGDDVSVLGPPACTETLSPRRAKPRTVWTVTFGEGESALTQCIVGITGRMWASDGRHFVVLEKRSSTIGPSAVWTRVHLLLDC